MALKVTVMSLARVCSTRCSPFASLKRLTARPQTPIAFRISALRAFESATELRMMTAWWVALLRRRVMISEAIVISASRNAPGEGHRTQDRMQAIGEDKKDGHPGKIEQARPGPGSRGSCGPCRRRHAAAPAPRRWRSRSEAYRCATRCARGAILLSSLAPMRTRTWERMTSKMPWKKL